MRPRVFLDLAKRLVIIPNEANWRCAAGRAYYALMLECRDALGKWGFALPKRDSIHFFVRSRFINTNDPDLQIIGKALLDLVTLRNDADYEMTASVFTNDVLAKKRIAQAEDALKLLDAIDADPIKRTAAFAEIQSRWP
ncbi:MAG: hypothetical protein K8T89_08430 [Planctomycetes bacterium]|nr:hypothetical protein [Planctomycetota bacterium]